MEWRRMYLDLSLVPLALLSSLLYHIWLWNLVKRQPHRSYVSMNTLGQRTWIKHMLKDNDKKNVLAIQTLRNNIMGATLMGTTSILICCGILTFASKAYGMDKPDDALALGGNNELKISSKCAAMLLGFLSAFVCEALSITCLTQVNILINVLPIESSPAREDLVTRLLEKGVFFCSVGNRIFFTTLPFVLWIFGPVLVFLCSVGMLAVLYSVDVVADVKDGGVGAEGRRNGGDQV